MWVSRRGRGKKYSIYPLRFFCSVSHNRVVRHGPPLAGVHVAQITGVITGEGRGRQTKPGSHPRFPFDRFCPPSIDRSIDSIRIYVSNWPIHRFPRYSFPFPPLARFFIEDVEIVNNRENSIARNDSMIRHLATNLANRWRKKKKKKRSDFWPDVETLNGKWTSVEFALVWPPIAPVVSYLRIIYVRVNT